ncbi:AzlD domain-containing protein [Neorhizobium galegae]|uniref:AzlD domain-containing protein n=1 Tax=Neorhizobium galegae TaxID=399 RepID=UPI000621F70C|nr:AzlD domain-containing protein [Neorhizobium galegae]CDZ29218.1 Branched-chain amino acid transport protein (AzlD) [Neorhizobium galegae bv. officinalis]KAA9387013.1 AzlD domain-containing protein [Neorhizobium galegae]KAB1116125.1 AzlD domain-containing protein [Neorhizobium galegae]MCM2499999.1 AzlD domain-containing protein [Neorhizobium galegae]MCQ1771345.1 AzlD domain-containing protein [Neorhizobium galegae]
MIAEYWTFIVIAVAGFVATDIWRWLGVFTGNRLNEDSEALYWVRAVATSLVMAVTAKLIVFPNGTLAGTPLWLRVGAAGIGFAVFVATGRKVGVGVAVPMALLVAGIWWGGF